MKVADRVMAGKASDSSIKWQLCYDMSARTWWMVSWCDNFFFFPPWKLFFSFLNSSFTAAMHVLRSSECAKFPAPAQWLRRAPKYQPARQGFSAVVVAWAFFLKQQEGQHGVFLSPFSLLSLSLLLSPPPPSPLKCKFCSACQPSWCENVEVEAVTGKKKAALSSCSWLIVLELVLKIEQSASLFCFLWIII